MDDINYMKSYRCNHNNYSYKLAIVVRIYRYWN